MASLTYADELRDPRWQRKRLDIWNRASNRCENCGTSQRSMEVHHCYYERNKKPWEYPDESLLLLCENCHESWHARKLRIDKNLSGLLILNLDQMQFLTAGLRCILSGEDYFFRYGTDPLAITALIRGFWPPLAIIDLLIDKAFVWAQRREGFWLSDLIDDSVDLDNIAYRSLQSWHECAVKLREVRVCQGDRRDGR